MLGKTKPAPPPAAADLMPWLAETVRQPAAQIQVKLRGNILHVLCESADRLERDHTLLRLVKRLLEADVRDWFSRDFAQVYQLYFYSRTPGQKQPDWSAPLYLNRLERHLDQLVTAGDDAAAVQETAAALIKSKTKAIGKLDKTTSAIVLSNVSLARKGDPDAIARYLSETLSALDIGVEVSVRAVPGKAKRAKTVMALRPVSVDPAAELINRLWVFCQASYSPDPTLVANPTAQRLRALGLTQFQDAVLSVQVVGESEPDWRLRVDLTPPLEILKEWARWGDREAITRLVNGAIAPLGLRVTSELKDATLHLVCAVIPQHHFAQNQPDQDQPDLPTAVESVAAIAPLLDQLGPQGIHRTVVYGPAIDGANPLWLECLALPATEHQALAEQTETLAQQGDLPAIAYQLTRLLNPDLDAQLKTGGVRVQLLRKDQCLHVMTDAPWCPARQDVVPLVIRYFRQHKLKGTDGIRIYGRRSGQKQPDWNHGYDFQARPRLVPEATPQFAASDTYLSDLIEPEPATSEALERDSDGPGLTLGQVLLDIGRQILLQTQLFTPVETAPTTPVTRTASQPHSRRLALVWGAVGVLLAVQTDWILGQMVSSVQLTPEAETAEAEEHTEEHTGEPSFADELAQLDWGQPSDDRPFAQSDRPGDVATSAVDDADLLSSPGQDFVSLSSLVAESPFPSFTSRQLDEKLALYDQRVQESGAPDVLIVGSSRALRGVDPTALRQALAALGYEEVSVFNFGINGSTAQVVDFVVRQLLQSYPPPRLVLWADGARAFNSGRVDVTYNAIAVSPGYEQLQAGTLFPSDPAGAPTPAIEPQWNNLSEQISSYYTQLDDQVSQTLAATSLAYAQRDRAKTLLQRVHSNTLGRFSQLTRSEPEGLDPALSEGDLVDFDGFLPLSVRFNPATYYQDHARVAGAYDSDYEAFQLEGVQTAALTNLLDYTEAQGIPVVFVNTPLTDEYLDSTRQQAEAEFQRYMVQVASESPGFFYRDLGQLWAQRYDYFSDPSHLNRYGAYQVSYRLAQDPLIPWTELD